MQVSAEHLSHSLGERLVLDDCSLSVAPGASLAILGPSGCGKSTLLHILAGLLVPDSGSVFWGETSPYNLPAREREGRRLSDVGLLRQTPHLHPLLSARENVLLPATFRTVETAEDRCDRLMARADITSCRDVAGDSVSGGQLIRVALVRSLLPRPRILVADEPTATLDAITARTLEDLLFTMSEEEGVTLILATHEQDLARRCNERLDLSA
ncbi:MAG: ABC transporter ATP-binding protein [Planctomycetota bacterium]